jgi:hypothetical protein
MDYGVFIFLVCACQRHLLGKFFSVYFRFMEPGWLSQYSDWLRTGQPGLDPRQMHRIFLLASASRPALGPTQPPVHWVPGVLSPGVKRSRGVTLTTHPHLVPRLSMSRSYTSSPPSAPPWHVAGQLYFFFRFITL